MQLSNDEYIAIINRYQNDPYAFFQEILGIKEVWAKMTELANSVKNEQRTVVFAGHGVSKSYTAAAVVLWFLTCFPPATVITTAPSNDQVENILWREIRNHYANAKIPLGGHLTSTKLDYGEKWFAYGFATKPDTVTQEATRFQGYHNDNVLVVFDEAAGIMPQIYKAAEHLLTSGFCRWLAIGNPTSPFGNFAALQDDPTWNFINISVLDTPNYKVGNEIIPGVSGRVYEERMRTKYGINSNEYRIRVLGIKPEFGEGTYYGKWLADAEASNRINICPYDPAAPVYTFWDIGDTNTAIWFAQFIDYRINLIDCFYDCKGEGLPHYAKMLQNKGYVYGQHFAPHDIQGSNKNSFQTGKTTMAVANSLNIPFKVLTPHRVEDRHEAVRGILPKCFFDKKNCAEGIEALCNYRKKRNENLSTEEKPVYYEEPVKDWTRHLADAFGYMAMAYRFDLIGGKKLGSFIQRPQFQQLKTDNNWISLG